MRARSRAVLFVLPLLLAALGVAGVVTVTADPPAPTPATTAVVAPEAAPRAATPPVAYERQPAGPPAPSMSALAAPTRGRGMTAQCRLARRDRTGPQWQVRYCGDCDVLDEHGARLAQLQGTADTRPLAFSLPQGVARVRFEAAGHRSVDRDVPPMADGVLDFGTVVLAPDAAMRVRLRNVPAGGTPRVECRVRDDRFHESTPIDAQQFDAGVVLPAPSGRALRLVVASAGGTGLYFRAEVDGIVLQPGEERDCEVDVAALPVAALHVVGPSPAILAQLAVRWSEGTDPERNGEVRLDAAGRAELRGVATGQLSFVTICANGQCALRPSAATPGQELELAPETPLAGVQLRAATGACVPFVLNGRFLGEPRLLQVVLASGLAEAKSVTASADAIGTLRWPTGAIAWNGDIGTLDAGAATRTGELVVATCGTKPEPLLRFRFRLCLQQPDGTSTSLRHTNDQFRFTDLAPGDYSLRWQIADHPGGLAAETVVVRAGAPTELVVPWPAFTLWEGQVTNWRTLPASDRLGLVRFGSWQRFHEGTQLQVDDAGRFSLPLPADSAGPGEVVEFRQGTVGFAGRVVAVDRPGHRVMIEHPPVRWVGLKIAARTGKWLLRLRQPGSDLPWAHLGPSMPARVPLPPGLRLEGELCEKGEDQSVPPQLACFVVVDGSAAEVAVVPSGHWCTLRLERPGTKLTACVLDPRGKPTGFHGPALEPGNSHRLWVPDGASGIQVTLQPGGVLDFAATRDEIAIQ